MYLARVLKFQKKHLKHYLKKHFIMLKLQMWW